MTKQEYSKSMKDYGKPCQFCGNRNHPYMVKHSLWNQVVQNLKGFTCLFCFEEKLGRPLTEKDFIIESSYGELLPINHGMFGFDCRIWSKIGDRV